MDFPSYYRCHTNNALPAHITRSVICLNRTPLYWAGTRNPWPSSPIGSFASIEYARSEEYSRGREISEGMASQTISVPMRWP